MGAQMQCTSRVVLIMLCFACSGCVGEAVEQATQSATKSMKKAKATGYLRNLGLLYQSYHDMHRRGPASWEEAKAYSIQNYSTSQPLDKLREMGYTVNWGMRMQDVIVGTSNYVLAYPSDGPQNGGSVLMMDGSVQSMTAAELNTALANQASIQPAVQVDSGSSGGNPSGGAPLSGQ